MARAAQAAGTIMCLSTFATSTPADVAATGATCWYQLYVPRDDGVARDVVEHASRGFGARADVDPPRVGRRERDLRTGFNVPGTCHPRAGPGRGHSGRCP